MKNKLIFNLFKDKALDIQDFKKLLKDKFDMDNYYEIYVDIINYQIDRYGCQLYEYDKEFSTINTERKMRR